MKKINIYIWCNKVQIPEYFNFYVNQLGCKFDILRWSKCLHSSTHVLIKSKDGTLKRVPLKDIARANTWKDMKFFDGGNWVNIKNIVPNDSVSEYLTITLRNGNEIKCTKEHKFSVNGEIIEAQKLTSGMILDNSDIRINDNNNATGITSKAQWSIGYFIANGSYDSSHRLQIATNKNKSFVLDTIKSLCDEYDTSCCVYDSEDGNKRNICISSKVLSGIIDTYVSGKLSYGKHLNPKCFNVNKSFLENIIQGYLDGDGFYDKENNRYRIGFTRKNIGLMQDLLLASNILGYNIHVQKSHATFSGKKYPVFNGEIRKTFSDKCKSGFEVVNIALCNNTNFYSKFYDLQLDNKNHLFTLFDGVLTHNCNALPTYSNKYLSDTEFCLYFRKGGKCQPQSYEDAKTYFSAPINIKDKKLYGHPTCKPVDMLERLIRNSSNEGDIVLDPFMGSGSTGHACANLNREFWGSELSPEFFNTAKKRIEDAYGEHSEIIHGIASNSTQNKTEEYEQVSLW